MKPAVPVDDAAMPHNRSGHREQLPSGSWWAKVYAGKDPLTGREIRFRKTCKTKHDAQIELGSSWHWPRMGGGPDSDVTLAELLGQYVQTAGGTCPPGKATLGTSGVPPDRPSGPCGCARSGGPLLDMLYAGLTSPIQR
jgi:hypothetical protein